MTARVLIIAGSDSGGGAGIQADIKTVTLLGAHAMTAITALTAQNTLGVQGVHPVPTDFVLAQIDSVVGDIGVDAVKIGMIGSAVTSAAVVERLARDDLRGVPVVFDPVMVATSGSVLADDATIAAFGALMDRATIATPNREELTALGGVDAVLAHGCALLEKGGHDEGELLTDTLHVGGADAPEPLIWEAPRIDTRHTHGTGCTLASAIATGLAQGMALVPAVARARDVVRLALHAAPGLGQGAGPMGHADLRTDGIFTGPALNHVTLPAHDVDVSVAFYRRLGLKQIVAAQHYARFEAANGVTLSVELSDAPAGGAVTYIESGAFDAWTAYLSRKGVAFDQQPRDEEWGWREARLTDPAGNALCLYQAGEYRRFPPWRVQ